jgi:putative membrane protein
MRRLCFASFAMAGLLAAGASGAQPREARHFLTDAIRGDNSEMMLGQMAAERGASPALRAFGQTLHDDHAQARQEAVRLAANFGISDTQAPMPEAVKERRKLERLHGRAFDREFAHYMVGDHRKDIAEFRKAARQGGPTAELAQRTLPTLQKHLAMAQRLDHG